MCRRRLTRNVARVCDVSGGWHPPPGVCVWGEAGKKRWCEWKKGATAQHSGKARGGGGWAKNEKRLFINSRHPLHAGLKRARSSALGCQQLIMGRYYWAA